MGMVRIDGKLRTVQRAGWEFAYGPLRLAFESIPALTSAPVSRSPTSRCHLLVRNRRDPPNGGGSGSIRELHTDVWQLAITDTTVQRRRYFTVEGNRDDAEAALDRVRALLDRGDLGDLRVRELVGRYLEVTDPDARRASTPTRDRLLLHDYIEPAIGDELAALVTSERSGEVSKPPRTPVRRCPKFATPSVSFEAPTDGPLPAIGFATTQPPTSIRGWLGR